MGLLLEPRFLFYFLTQFFGAFNDNFLKGAIIILLTYTTNDFGIPPSQMVALAGGVFILPFFLFSATAGQLADKFEKQKLIQIIKFAEILITILAVYGFIHKNFEFLLAVLFLMGAHSAFFGPIKYSILPSLLPSEADLIAGNAIIEGATFIAILLGTIAGTLLADLQRPWTSLCLVFVAAFGYFCSLKIPKQPPPASELKIDKNPLFPTVKILKLIFENKMVAISIFGISWFWFFGAAMLSLIPTFVKDVLHENAKVVTLCLSIFSIGIAVGSMLCAKISKGKLKLQLMPAGALGIVIFTFELSQADPILNWQILFQMFMVAVSSGLFIVPLYILMQEFSKSKSRSRTIAANNILNAFFMVIASISLLLLLRAGLSIYQIFFVLAISQFIYGLILIAFEPKFLKK